MNSASEVNDSTFTLDDQLDVAIPRFSHQTVLDEFPVPAVDDYSGPASISHDNIQSDLSLQLPFQVAAARSRVVDGVIDMRYELKRHDALRGERSTTVGRKFVPAQGAVCFRTSPAFVKYKTVLTPVSAALAADVVDKNVATAATLIKILFPDTTPQDNINMNARAVIRNLADQTFSPHRYVWRLASLYVAAAWAEVSGCAISSNQRDLAPFTYINSVSAFDGVLASWDSAMQPIAIRYEGMADMVSPLITILRLAASAAPLLQTTSDLALPTVATAWPAMGATTVYYTGPRLANETVLGNIDSATVWEAALLWCGQHGTFQLFNTYIATISALWSGPVAKHAPILQSERFSLSLPVSYLQPTILTPISQAYVTWRSESVLQEQPDKHTMFLTGAARSLAIGLAVRTYGYRAGMPYVEVIARASTERDFIFSAFRKVGDSTAAMFHAQATLRGIGCTGTLGGVLLSMSPEFPHVHGMQAWWSAHRTAFQWEELANLTNSVPRCCALLGVVRPLHAVKPPMVNVWYGPDLLVGARCVEEALQGMCYVPQLELAWQLSDARSGTTTTHPVRRVKNYRDSFSDWQFAAPYAKDFARIEMTFRVTSTEGALLVHSGPMGQVPWKWYVSRPVVAEDLHFSGAPLASNSGGNQPLVEPVEDDIPPSVYIPPGANPPLAPEVEGDGTVHEAAPGATQPGDMRVTEVPLSIVAKADKLRTTLKDCGQSAAWVDQLLLGLGRQYETTCAWNERDCEGRMRGAWDEVEQLDPLVTLRAIPNGARANSALLMSQLFAAAAPCAHSLSGARGWVGESIRMGNRARALRVCSALTKVELEDWTSTGRVKKTPGLSDHNIALGLAAGVPASDLVLHPPLQGHSKLVPDEEAWQQLNTGAQAVEQSTCNEFENLIKLEYDRGAVAPGMVEELLGYVPLWVVFPPIDEVNPSDANTPLPPDPDIKPVVHSPEADNHIAIGDDLIADLQNLYGDDHAEEKDFGDASGTTTMSPPIASVNTSEAKPIPPPAPPRPVSSLMTVGVVLTPSVSPTPRLDFTD